MRARKGVALATRFAKNEERSRSKGTYSWPLAYSQRPLFCMAFCGAMKEAIVWVVRKGGKSDAIPFEACVT